MDDDKIKYSDIIEPDGSIDNLIKQLGDLNKSYETMVNAIRAGADRMVHAIKSASGATEEGRKTIDETTASTSRLERAQKELKIAVSDTGKQIAWLKAQTSDVNRASVEQQRYIKQMSTSYDRLKSDLKQMTSLYKSLTDAEREDSAMGKQLLQDILNLKTQIGALDAQMKPYIATLTETEKAQQRLDFLMSAEGQKLLDIKARISEVTSARKQAKASTDAVAAAIEKLNYAQSGENEQIKLYTTLTNEANRVAQLKAQIQLSEEGSYNRLSAQYALNKIELNKMSQAQRETTDSGKALVAETNNIYQEMIKLQEATGNHRLSVGHYQKTWDGLGISVSQVVRELPAAAVSLNTFFLGISNNIPMLVDEINRLRAKNLQLQAEGKATVSVTKALTKAFFGWNTALVVVLTVLSMYGGQIIKWVGSLFKGREAVISLTDALKNVAEEVKKTNPSFGSNMVSLKQLREEWKNLESTADKTQWIRDNKTEFDKLGISITDINDAENVFVDNTQAVVDALKLRAKAAAASKLAADKYEEALVKQNEAELEKVKRDERVKNAQNSNVKSNTGTLSGVSREAQINQVATNYNIRIKDLEEESKVAEKTADSYFELAAGYEEAAKAALKAAGIDEKTKGPKKQPKGRQPRDMSDQLNRTSTDVQKKYEESLAKLERESYAKRRKEAIASYNSRSAALMDTFEKNKKILENEDGLYKELTDEQKTQTEETQKRIIETVESYQKELNQTLKDLEYDRQIDELKILEETIQLRLKAVKKGTIEELNLRLASIEAQKRMALLSNEKKPASERQSSADITSGFDKQSVSVTTDYDTSGFDQQMELEAARFNMVEQTEKAITKFKLEQEKQRWQEQIRLAEAGALDWSKTQIDTAKATVKGIDRELADLDDFIKNMGKNGLGNTLLESMGFSDDQIDALGEATNIVIEQLQSIMAAEVELAEAAVQAAQERVDAAKSSYDAEVEARNNGYANNVATAKKELEQEKKNQQEKQKQLEEAQKRQEAVNTVIQASSLVTASANLWSSLSSIPIVGPALAIAAIATMWGSFAAAKVKANQVTSQSEEYGEGGLEFLDGGSHASGNDIDLGTRNSRGKNMRAEGGEALAIVNKKNTRRYKKILPDVINSLNKGNFEDKYLNAFSQSDNINLTGPTIQNIDLSKLEDDVASIKKNSSIKYTALPDGTIIVRYKNVKRVIKPN